MVWVFLPARIASTKRALKLYRPKRKLLVLATVEQITSAPLTNTFHEPGSGRRLAVLDDLAGWSYGHQLAAAILFFVSLNIAVERADWFVFSPLFKEECDTTGSAFVTN